MGCAKGKPVEEPLSPRSVTATRPGSEYQRPAFLAMSSDEVLAVQNKAERSVITWKSKSGCLAYAEVVNAGKTPYNEDQAAYYKFGNTRIIAIFDGHGGWGCSFQATSCLERALRTRLDTPELVAPPDYSKEWAQRVERALVESFFDADRFIQPEMTKLQLQGGSTAICAMLIGSHLFVANSGDCRAILVNVPLDQQQSPTFVELSRDCSPENETFRLQRFLKDHPELLGGVFNRKIFLKPALKDSDLGAKLPCLDFESEVPLEETVTEEDIQKVPFILRHKLVTTQKKDSKLLGTLGVTRGFGDYDLLSTYGKVPVKPFLSPEPDVRHLDLSERRGSSANTAARDRKILVMACDGFWDAFSNEFVSYLVARHVRGADALTRRASAHLNEQQQASLAGRDLQTLARLLLESARGKRVNGSWRIPAEYAERERDEPVRSVQEEWWHPRTVSPQVQLADERVGSGDDITLWLLDVTQALQESSHSSQVK